MQQSDQVTLTIDGKQVSVPKGTLVLDAAKKLGIDIPIFCYHEKMEPLGACRMCLVSIERAKGFPPACATPVAEGMVVTTKSEAVEKTRRGILEFLLINHPLDCPICDKGGECPLQNHTFKFGPGVTRFVEDKRHFAKSLQIGPQIVLDRERCIMCQLCVRFMDIIADDAQLVMINRGDSTEIGTYPGRPFDSVFSGNVTDICPVGALTSKSYRFLSRPWDLEHTPSVCPTCPVGCNIDINTRRGQLMRLTPRENTSVDDGWLCDIGRYGTLSWARYERVTTPMVKKNGQFLPVSWDEALETAITGLRASRANGMLAGLASARSTNEELYLFGRLLRGGLRTPHLDTIDGSRAGTERLGGAPIEAIEDADAIVLVDADPIARQMVLHLRLVKAAKRRDVHPVVISNDPTGMDKYASARLGYDAARLSTTLRDLARAITAARQNASLDTVPAPVAQAARLLATAKRGLVIYDERVLDEPDGSDVLSALRALEALLANLDDLPTARLLALAKDTNSRGAAEMGVAPALLAGGRPMDDVEWFNTLSSAWGLPMQRQAGLDAAGILKAGAQGELDGLFLLDCDPLAVWPDEGVARKALQSVPFLVVQTPLLTPTAELAHVILPSAGFGEVSGTLTNLEGRVQSLGRAVAIPGEARDGWEILSLLSGMTDVAQTYGSAAEVTQEIIDVLDLPAWRVLGRYPRRALAAAGEAV
ncbi:MAG TPA: NADH-quinone oxidoreductase subunit NuoG [Chloroflexota bacterium]|nr:NADH-quinone oxidoreductase subunit NuoG [Chloroflexota bacterium]